MKAERSSGFTLIELLTVIAIIAILAGLAAVGLPRALEKAKIADVEGDFNAIRNTLASYAADHGGYPPGYGYIRWGATGATEDEYHLDNYMETIGMFRAMDAYDRFSPDTHDTNKNNSIDPLEFCPVGTKVAGTGNQYTFPTDLFPYGAGANADAVRQLKQQRPYLYIPVNSGQAKRVSRYYYSQYEATGNADYLNARGWDPTNKYLSQLTFPPPSYDAYVLISMGPAENTFGVVTPPVDGDEGAAVYHILGLRAYFLATRDANGNGELDFDFRSRTRRGEGKADNYDNGELAKLPDGSFGYGPLIYVVD